MFSLRSVLETTNLQIIKPLSKIVEQPFVRLDTTDKTSLHLWETLLSTHLAPRDRAQIVNTASCLQSIHMLTTSTKITPSASPRFLLAAMLVVVFSFLTVTGMMAQCVPGIDDDFSTNPILSETAIDGAWYPDRYAPYAFVSNGSQLTISINEADGAQSRGGRSGGFYNTQGRKINQGNCLSYVQADLYVPAEWETNHRRSGLWATAVNETDEISLYPIIAFRNEDGSSPGFFYFDGNVGWIDCNVSVTYNQSYNLRTEIRGTNALFYINGEIVGSIAANGSDHFSNIILQAFNFYDSNLAPEIQDTPPTSNYDAIWDNLKTGNGECGIETGGVVTYTGNVTIASQDDLDAFIEPGTNNKYTEIDGSLSISGNVPVGENPITDFCNLSMISSVTGVLNLANWDEAAALSSTGDPLGELTSLSSVDGAIQVANSNSFVNGISLPFLEGTTASINLANLTHTESIAIGTEASGSLTITSFISITGSSTPASFLESVEIPNLVSTGGNLDVSGIRGGNVSTIDFSSLETITGGRLRLQGLGEPVSDADVLLPELTSVSGYFLVQGIAGSIVAGESGTDLSVGEYFSVIENVHLSTLTTGLTSVGGNLIIKNADLLTTLDAEGVLSDLETVEGNVQVIQNDVLGSCCVFPCSVDVTGTRDFSSNKPGGNCSGNEASVIAACTPVISAFTAMDQDGHDAFGEVTCFGDDIDFSITASVSTGYTLEYEIFVDENENEVFDAGERVILSRGAESTIADITGLTNEMVVVARVYNVEGGCSAFESYTLAVNTLPVVSFTADPVGNVCLGTTSQYLSGLSEGDEPDHGSYSFLWGAHNGLLGGPSGANPNKFSNASISGVERIWDSGAGDKSVTFDIATPGCENVKEVFGFRVLNLPTSGSIGGDQSVCSVQTPDPIMSVSNGSGAGVISYRWEKKETGDANWQTISGATDAGLSPGPLAGTTMFRRYTINDNGGDPAPSCESAFSTNTVTITVEDDVIAPVPDEAMLADAIAQCSITVDAPTATDVCVGEVVGTTTDPTTYTGQGTYTINWSYDDGNGNVSTQQQTVIIEEGTGENDGVTNMRTSTTYCTIQSAIEAAEAGDVLNVSGGFYDENVVIDKALTLKGANADVACGTNAESLIAPATGTPVSITADDVTLNGFEITAPDAYNAVVVGGVSNTTMTFNNIHDIGTNLSGGQNVHAIVYNLGSENSANLSVTNNCLNNISSSTLSGFSASAIAVLQSISSGVLTNLAIDKNTISNVNVNTGSWPTGKIAYGVLINVGSNGYTTSTGKVVNAVISSNEIAGLSGFISTGIGMEGNTENAEISNNIVTNLSGSKFSGNRSGGGYDLSAVKFESNRYVSTCTVMNNSFAVNTFSHSVSPGKGYAVSNYVPVTEGGVLTLNCNWFSVANADEIKDNATFTGLLFNKDDCETNFSPYLVGGGDGAGIGFQPTESCTGTPVVIDLVEIQDELCETTGWIELSFSGGTGPYSIAWDGDATGSVNNVTSTHTIPNLETGAYGITVTDSYGSTDITTATVEYLPVENTTAHTFFATIQEAITAAQDGETIIVCAGIYAENLTIDKEVILNGPNAGVSPNGGARITEAIIVPAASETDVIAVEADNVVIDGFIIDGDNPEITTGWTGTNGADIDAYDGIYVADPNNVIVVNSLRVQNNIFQNLGFFAVDIFGWHNYSNPSTSGHLVENNLFRNLGTYESDGATDSWGGGVLLYNDNYARITNNVMTNVRLGIQTGNFHDENPGDPSFQVIDNNTIEARRLGVFYNLHTGGDVEALTFSNNTVTGLADAHETKWDGIKLSSLTDAIGQVLNNVVDGAGVEGTVVQSLGYNVWNVRTSSPVNIQDCIAKNVDIGVFVNNFEGYGTNAGNTAAVIDGATLTDNVKIGILVKDSPDNTNGSNVGAEIKGNTDVATNTTDGIGIQIEGADASANIHDNLATISGNNIGVLVDAGTADITDNTIANNIIGVRFQNGGTGTVNNNNITGNTIIGVDNTTGVDIDASNNWWGDATGPGEVAVGAGDKISIDLTYCPWLDDVSGTGSSVASVYNTTQETYHCTIQDAIDAVTTVNGDVIQLSPGTYAERVTISKELTIQGASTAKGEYVIDGSSLAGEGSGIFIETGVENVTIENLTVQNFSGTNGNSHAGIYANRNNHNLTVNNVALLDNVGGSGFYANGPVDGVTVSNSMVSGHTTSARGIVIWGGFKENITITNNTLANNNCCGIELQDGTSSAVNISNNTIDIGIGDNAIAALGMNPSTGPNFINGNTITGGGRFGIEIKNPDGGITVSGNSVELTVMNADVRDRAGIAIMRRDFTAGNPAGYADVPNGVTVTGNTVTGYTQSSGDEGFGIVVEGANHVVSGNILSGNDIGIQLQGGGHANAMYVMNDAGSGSQNPGDSPMYFGRGNSPVICSVEGLGANTMSGNGTDYRLSINDVSSPTAPRVTTDLAGINSYLNAEISYTINGTTIGNTNDGSVNDSENVTITVCDEDGNVELSTITPDVANVGMTVFYATTTNIAGGTPADQDFKVNTFNSVLGTEFLPNPGTYRLADPLLAGQVVYESYVYNDANDNGILDPSECTGDKITVTINIQPLPVVVDQVVTGPICSGDPVGVNFSPSTSTATAATYNVTEVNVVSGSATPQGDYTGSGLSASDLADDVFINTSGADAVVEYTVVPVSSESDNACVGDPFTVTVHIATTPLLSDLPDDISVGTSSNNPDSDCFGVVDFTAPTMSGGCFPVTGMITYDQTMPAGVPTGFVSGEMFTQVTFPIGVTTVTFVVEDGASVPNSSSDMSFMVTVLDDEAPSIVCPAATTINVDEGICGAAFATENTGNATGTDNCAGTVTITNDAPTTLGLGSTTVTFTADDGDVNSANTTCTQVITVIDNEAPSIVCAPDVTIGASTDCNLTLTGTGYDATAADNCSVAGITNSLNAGASVSGEVLSLGATTITFTAEDGSGNTSMCTTTITIVDNTAPTATCQDITVTLGENGTATIEPSDLDDGSADNCGTVTFAASQTSFDCTDIGSVAVTLTVTDAAGNSDTESSTCVANVLVEDILPIIVMTPGDITLSNEAGLCSATATWTEPMVEAVDYLENFEGTENSFIDYDGGTMTITASGTNGVTSFEGGFHGVANQGNTGPFGRLGGYSSEFGNGYRVESKIYIDLTDAQVAAGTYGFDLSVAANGADGVHQRDFVFHVSSVDAAGQAFVGASNGTTFSIQSTTSSNAFDTKAEITATGWYTFEWIFYDNGTGTLAVDMNVSDDAGTQLFTETSSNAGDAIATEIGGNRYMWFTVISAQNGIPVDNVQKSHKINIDLTSTHASGASFNVGTETVTYTATTECGAEVSSSFDVTVNDTEMPIAGCQDIDVFVDESGNVSTTAEAINLGSSDNCTASGDLTLMLDRTAFSCADIGSPVTVTLTVIDASLNEATCTASVTVLDEIDPTALCQNISINLDASGNTAIAPADVNGGSTDNCTLEGDLILAIDDSSFDCSDAGTLAPVVLTVEDAYGNSSTCTAQVTVNDITPPTMVCMDAMVDLDGTGMGSITVDDIDDGSSDACGIATRVLSQSDFGCNDVGQVMVTLTVTDVNGNSNECEQMVTVRDLIEPDAMCQDISVSLDASGNASISAGDVNNGSTDNCAISSLSVSPASFTCSEVGANTVTLTVNDVNGNSSTCDATVIVTDLLAPAFAPEPADEILTTDGLASCPGEALVSLTDGDVVDAGESFTIAGLTRNAPEFTDNCSDNTTMTVGVVEAADADNCSRTFTLSWTLNDGTNQTAATQVYTIEDNTDPVLNLIGDALIELCEDGTYTEPGVTVTDECTDDLKISVEETYTYDDGLGEGPVAVLGGVDETAVGTYVITYTATDICGNSTSIERTVEVRGKPVTDPTLLSICIGSSETISGNAMVGANNEAGTTIASYLWTYGGGSASGFTINGGFVSAGQTYTTEELVIDAGFASAGNAIFTLQVTDSDLGCASDSPVFQVVFNATATAGTAISPSEAFCEDEGNVDLFSLLDGENAGGSFVRNGGDGTGGTLTGSTFNTSGAEGTFTFTYTVGDDGCVPDSEDITFTVDPEPNAGTFNASTAAICTDAADFDLTTLLDDEDEGGTFIKVSGTGGTLTGGLFDPTGATPGTFTFQYTVAGGECDDAISNVSIQIDGAADAGNATAGFADGNTEVDICSDFGTIDLNNLLDGTQTGGGAFAFADTGAPGTLIGSSYNPGNLDGSDVVFVRFTYTVNGSGACAAGSDVEIIQLGIQPAPDAGTLNPEAQNSVCTNDLSFDLFTLLSGEDDGGTWTELTNSGAVLYGDNNALIDASMATPGAGYQFAYIVSSTDPCQTSASITVTVNFNEVATADAGEDQTICFGESASLNGTFGGGATAGAWEGGTGTFSPDRNDPSATYTPDVSEAGTVVTLTFVAQDPDGTAGPCSEVTDGIDITVNDAVASINAGEATAVCYEFNGPTTVTLSGEILLASGAAGTGIWTTDGTGSLDDPTSPSPVYTAGEADAGSLVTFTYTANDPDDAGPCVGGQFDIVTLNVEAVPTISVELTAPAAATIDAENSYESTVCNGTAFTGALATTTPFSSQGDPLFLAIALTDPEEQFGFGASSFFVAPAFVPDGEGGMEPFGFDEMLVNSGTEPITLTFAIAPYYETTPLDPGFAPGKCVGQAIQVNITINPVPTVADPADQVVCEGTMTTEVTFVADGDDTNPATTYSYTVAGDMIGVPADDNSGTIVAFEPTATGTATITVTPTFTDGGISCDGPTQEFTITVNEGATVDAGADQTICPNATATLAATIGGSATGGTWTGANAGELSDENDPAATFTPDASRLNTTVTLTFTSEDPEGPCPAVSDMVEITVQDLDAPDFVAQDDIDVSNDPDNCSAEVSFGVTEVTDNCYPESGITVTYTIPVAMATDMEITSPAIFPVGATTVSVLIEDAAGNSATSSFTVTVTDTEAPMVSCPAGPLTTGTDAGQCAASVAFEATATDNCDTEVDIVYTIFVSEIPAVITSGYDFPIGTTTVTATATDDEGLTSTCAFDVTVTDDEAPMVSCPVGPLTAGTDAGLCTASIAFEATATDNCDTEVDIVYTIFVDESPVEIVSGYDFPTGTTTVTATATDDGGITSSCTFVVIVTDTEAPMVSCPVGPLTAGTDEGLCTASVTFEATATDNCDTDVDIVYTIVVDESPVEITSGYDLPTGITTVTATATDDTGLTNTCTFDVEVTDDENPVITCPDDITVVADAGLCTAVVAYADAAATDNCGATVSLDAGGMVSGSAFPIGETVVGFTATDLAGNVDICSVMITVNDTEAPTIVCPEVAPVTTDPGVCGAVVTFATPDGADNCTGFMVAQTAGPVSGSTFDVGSTMVTFTVTDASELTAECSFTVEVADDEAPTIVCPEVAPVTTDPGVCGAVVTFATPDGADNCTGFMVAQTAGPVSGSTFDVGMTTVTFTVTDASELTAECSFTVEVADDEAPTIVCPEVAPVTTDPGVCGAVVTFATPDGADNCTGFMVAQTAGPVSGSTFDVGSTMVTFTVTDASELTAECSFIVVVADTEAPTIVCPEVAPVTTDPGVCGAVVTFATPDGADNCTGFMVAQTAGPVSGSTFDVGSTMVTFTVTDASELTAECSFTVVVTDDEMPTFAQIDDEEVTTEIESDCPAEAGTDLVINQVYASGTEFTVAGITYTSPAAMDNCEATVTVCCIAVEDEGCDRIITVTWTATDAAGNEVDEDQVFTITDNTIPMITISGDETVYVCQDGAYTDAGATASDNCAGDLTGVIVFDDSALDMTTPGSYELTYNVNDGCGNDAIEVTRTVVVNPVPVADPVADQTVCFGAMTDAVTFTSNVEGATFTYTVTGDDIGLEDGDGDIEAFIPVNTGMTALTATITVVPSFTAGGQECDGDPISFTITVEPEIDYSLNITAPDAVTLDAENTDYTATFCGGTVFTATDASSTTTGSAGPLWIEVIVNDPINALGFGPGTSTLYAPAGSFSFNSILENMTGAPVTITGTITPYFESEISTDEEGFPLGTPEGECAGTPVTFSITLDPEPVVTAAASFEEAVCSDEEFDVDFTETTGVADATFSWSVTTDPLPADVTINSGAMTGDISDMSITNESGTAQTINFEVVASTPDCDSDPVAFSVTVDPEPVIGVEVVTPVICSGDDVFVNFTETSGIAGGATFSWEITTTLPEGVTASMTSGDGNINELSFSNVSSDPVTISFTVDAVSGICNGDQEAFSVTVNPEPVGTDEALSGCAEFDLSVDLQALIGNNVVSSFEWYTESVTMVNGNTFVTGFSGTEAAPNTSSVIDDELINFSTQPQTVTYAVIPTSASGDCEGELFHVVVTLFGDVNAQILPVDGTTVCDGSSITLVGSADGGQSPFEFEYTIVSTTGTAEGSFSDPSAQTTEFMGTGQGTVRVQLVITDDNNCTSDPFFQTYTVIAAPSAQEIVGDNEVCPGAQETYSVVNDPNVTYSWALSSGGQIISSSAQSSVTVAWANFEGGPHTLTLTQSSANCSIQTTYDVNILDVNAEFSFVVSSDNGLSVDFTDASDQANSWLWDFDGQGTSTAQNPTFSFPFSGTYNVCLTIDGDCGMDELCKDVTVAFVPTPTCDEITLVPGINYISIDVAPADPSIATVLASVLSDISYVQGRNANGQVITFNPAFANFPGLNQLEDFAPYDGYIVRYTGEAEVTVSVCGTSLDPGFRRALPNGTSLIGFVPESPMAISDYFADLPSGVLARVLTRENGTTVTYDPAFASFPGLNGLDSLRNGFGYEVKTTAAVSGGTYFGEPVTVSAGRSNGNRFTDTYMVFAGISNLGEDAVGEQVLIVDEAGNVHGITEVIPGGYLMTTTIYGDDTHNETVGVQEGTVLYYQFGESRVEVSQPFVGDGRVFLEYVDFELLSDTEEEIVGDYLLSVSPNPFVEQIDITINLPVAGNLEVSIMDIAGKNVKSLISEVNVPAGNFQRSLDNLQLPSGTYLLQVEIDGVIMFNERMIRQQ
ncbi:HYR domain-containing protein [Neolewinella aurantiaca]|nr:HYR domain-containing protein [Neolewinella aurantiaca]